MTTPNHTLKRSLLSALAGASLITAFAFIAACEKKEAPVAKSPAANAPTPAPVAPTPSAMPSGSTAAAPSFSIPSVGDIDLASLGVEIPSQDALDVQAVTDITQQNADAAFKELEEDIEKDPGV